jgi:hypothetical protein
LFTIFNQTIFVTSSESFDRLKSRLLNILVCHYYISCPCSSISADTMASFNASNILNLNFFPFSYRFLFYSFVVFENDMSLTSTNQAITCSTTTQCSLPIADTYANAILRTLSSFKAPSHVVSRQHHRSYPYSTLMSHEAVNEVGSIKIYVGTYKSRIRSFGFLTLTFKWKLIARVAFLNFHFVFIIYACLCSSVMSYLRDVTIS